MNGPQTSTTATAPEHSRSLGANRLSIADLLLITLGSAIAIWVLQPPGGVYSRSWTAVNVAFSPLYGAALAVVILAVRADLKLKSFATQPGHWLLLWFGTLFATVGFAAKGATVPREILKEWSLVPQTLCVLASVCLALFGALLLLSLAIGDMEPSPRWRRVFQLMLAWAVTPVVCVLLAAAVYRNMAALIFVTAIFFAVPVILLVASIIAVAQDLRESKRRNFWHWLGVATLFGLPLHVVLLVVVANFL